MANSWPCLVVLVLSLAWIGPALGQFNPNLDKILQDKKALIDGIQGMQDKLDGLNVDQDKLLGLITERKEIRKVMKHKLSEIISGSSESVTIQVSPTGERYYELYLQTQSDVANNGGGRVLVYEQCMTDVLQYYEDLGNNLYYAGRMAASRGRPDFRNILYTGAIKDFGNYWLCTSTKENKTSGIPSFNGKYCLADPNENYGFVAWGTCWPDTCSQDDVNAVASFFWSEVLGIEPFIYYDCVEKYPWRTPEIGFLAAMSFFAFMVLFGSFYEVFLQERVLNKMRGHKTSSSSVHMKSVDNFYENKAATDDQGSDIATSSADGGSVAEEAVEKIGEEVSGQVRDDEKKRGASFDDGPTTTGEATIESPPKYREIDLSDHVAEKPASREPQKNHREKGNLGWALLHATLMSFSAVTNCRKLLSAKKTKNTLAVLNGLRVFSMWWVILGHTVQFNYGRYANTYQALSYLDDLGFTAISNATPSVDTFFVLSGFLVTYLSLKQIDSGKLKGAGAWAMFYFHRWWRLTPVYMAVMGVYTMLFPHFGPFIWYDAGFANAQRFCQATWWTHPLYINNLYPWPNVLEYSCMGWAWYLAVDMQFYIISPIILIALYKNRKAGAFVVTSMMLISLGSLFGISWYYGMTMNGQERYTDNRADPENADLTYTKPYTRLPTYLVGIVLGFIMFTLRGKKIKMSWIMAILGWIVAFTIMWWVIYGVYFTYEKTDVPQGVAVFYLTFHRLAWGISICWIIFACLMGYGGPISVLLDWSFWIPLGRLSYGAYLIHPVILYSKIMTDQVPFHFTYVSLSYLYVGNIVFSYVAALVLSLLIEGPFMGLEKVIFGKVKRS